MASKKTIKAVEAAQDRWAKAIVDIGDVYLNGGDVVQCATGHIQDLYGYGGNGEVLFKPTKCEHVQFRSSIDGALSYFVGDDFVKLGFTEDKGFAIAPYRAVHFKNHSIIGDSSRAIAMGNYFFVKLDGTSIKVEYTFGYRSKSSKSSKLVVDVHHSSLPYTH